MMVVVHLRWVDLDLGYSTALLQATAVAAYQPGGLPNSKSTQPRCATTMVTLY